MPAHIALYEVSVDDMHTKVRKNFRLKVIAHVIFSKFAVE